MVSAAALIRIHSKAIPHSSIWVWLPRRGRRRAWSGKMTSIHRMALLRSRARPITPTNQRLTDSFLEESWYLDSCCLSTTSKDESAVGPQDATPRPWHLPCSPLRRGRNASADLLYNWGRVRVVHLRHLMMRRGQPYLLCTALLSNPDQQPDQHYFRRRR